MRPKKQAVKSGAATQRGGGEECLQTAPSSTQKPRPRPSDVCVSSLMKKFWYLGETLLSAEQTLPPHCPQTPNSRPTQTQSHQASGVSARPLPGTGRKAQDASENPQSLEIKVRGEADRFAAITDATCTAASY